VAEPVFSASSSCTFLGLALALYAACSSPSLGVDALDYLRADRLRSLDSQTLGGQVSPVWMHDGVRFYYQSHANHEQPGTYFVVDPRIAQRRPLFDANRVAASLSQLSGSTIDPAHLPPWLLLRNDAEIALSLGPRQYLCDLQTSSCRNVDTATRLQFRSKSVPDWAVRSPDGKWDAFIWNHNVYIRPAALDSMEGGPIPLPSESVTGGNSKFGTALEHSMVHFQPTGQRSGCDGGAALGEFTESPEFHGSPDGSEALTSDGEALWSYGRRWKGGAEVATLDADRYRPTHGTFAWSPDSTKLLTRREDIRDVGIYPLYSSTSVRPIDHSYYYAGPGDTAIPQFQFYILDVVKRTGTKVDLPPIGLVLRPGTAEWSQDSRELYILSSDRPSKEARLSLVDSITGKAKTIIREDSSTFVEMSNGDEDTIVAVANAGSDIFWFSERDGWGHLYRYSKNGALKNQLERGAYSVAELIRVDDRRREVYFTAWAKEAGIPYYRHLYRINFDGSGLTHLTKEPGDHFIRRIGTSDFFLDTMSSIDSPPVTVVRRSDGSRVMQVSRGTDDALRGIGWRPAETFTVKARDGTTDLYGVMYRPSNFDSSKQYPIITNIYPGPFMGSVGRTWSFQGADNHPSEDGDNTKVTHGEGMGQSLAELGFIVIKLDALGSARRSKAIQDYFYGHVIDNGLPDQIAAIKQLAQRYPWIDITRVGIFGHSGGGFAAGAGMLLYPDFFKVGVSESGNHDFRTYGWYWGEKYQGRLNTAGEATAYEAQANYQYARNLKGKLLLIHGDMDCNNPPAETLRLVDALIKEQKDFDMLIVPDAGHQLPSYAMKRAWDYFTRYLNGEEPPTDYKLR
jgi:dipeptidyl aminopeptidase/acylaminoacyl peptidase